ncbi:hypothetical protein LZQ00_10895 [Sphingobacterium sp. SRCM116780]|uniref:hypothetical protein n=1 Tax=Sphingobacterium sp. SRCM116780 TaxID=2907623 RepID=UPI001F3A6815|nr:hypothetical protein [Sphingobacterium sp. SRCM116780]UIR54783.1 hypothetical protein LZQ00_10895 [Sphingobacterium sp. SRCM116780]
MKDAIAIEFGELINRNKVPQIIGINYNLESLVVTISFYDPNDEIIEVKFTSIEGFRVLDEGNLLEFWNSSRPAGWIWEIKENGWFDQEKKREGCLLGYMAGYNLKEYLILGQSDCISILCYNEPEIGEVKHGDKSIIEC